MEYGSANLQGFVFMDYTCLQTLNITGINNDDVLETNLRISKCAPFEFLALYKAEGLEEGTDGILGLSPQKLD